MQMMFANDAFTGSTRLKQGINPNGAYVDQLEG